MASDQDEPSEPVPPLGRIDVWLPGASWAVITEGNWSNDCPRGWADIEAGYQRRARGRGFQFRARLHHEDARDLADYLESVAGVVGGMTATERDGGNEHQAAARAAAVLRNALVVVPSQAEVDAISGSAYTHRVEQSGSKDAAP